MTPPVRRSWVAKVVFVFVMYVLTALVLFGCTTVKENPPQLTTDTTGHELANRNCLFFCYVTGTFTGSTARATNTGSARSTDSSSFTPSTEASHSLSLPNRRGAVVKKPIPVKPLKPIPKGTTP